MAQDYITLPSGLQYRREWEQTDGAVDMRNPKTLKRYTELQDEKYHIDCYKYDCFYAFGQKQFDENKKRIRPLRDGEKYVSAGAGLYGTRDGLDRLFAALKDIDEKIKQECDPQEVYFYEYNNHECQISWDGDIEPYNIILRIWGKEIASKIVRV
jgi:hypothetical protein